MDLNHASEQDLRDMRKWFFKENIRLQQEKACLEDERRQLEREKDAYRQEREFVATKDKIIRRQMEREKKLFEMKWKLLESELVKLAEDKRLFEQEKQHYQPLIGQAAMTQPYELFFIGVNSDDSLHKRYRDLLKIFHPDNLNGDTKTIQAINQQYDSLKKIFTGTV